MKNNAAIDYLDREAARFTELAKDLALDLLKNPFDAAVEKKKRLAHDHLLRAETYTDAARIVCGHSGPCRP